MEAHEEIEKEFHVKHIISQLRVCEGLARGNMNDEEYAAARIKYGLFKVSKETIEEADKNFDDSEL